MKRQVVPSRGTELTSPVDADQNNCTLTRTGRFPSRDLDLVGFIVPPTVPWMLEVAGVLFDSLAKAEEEARLVGAPIYCRLKKDPS